MCYECDFYADILNSKLWKLGLNCVFESKTFMR